MEQNHLNYCGVLIKSIGFKNKTNKEVNPG